MAPTVSAYDEIELCGLAVYDRDAGRLADEFGTSHVDRPLARRRSEADVSHAVRDDDAAARAIERSVRADGEEVEGGDKEPDRVGLERVKVDRTQFDRVILGRG